MSDIENKMLLSLLSENPEKKNELIKNLLSEDSETQVIATPSELKACFEAFKYKNTFKEGDLVCWKKNMVNRRKPHEGDPAIVVKVYEEPIFETEQDAGTPTFMEPYDIALGILDKDRDFVVYHFDSRRFEIYTES
jgi:hypothetical protein